MPLCQLGEKLGLLPFLDYSTGMNFNYRIAKGKELGYCSAKDFSIIRKFYGSQDEEGFYGVHVAMEQYSGDLVRHTYDLL